jgi:hypothetical protein
LSLGRARTPLLLALLCAALGGAIYVESAPPAAETAAAARSPATRAAQAPAREATFAMPPLASYREVVERPLFSETRRPAPKSVAAADPRAAGLTLKATLLSTSDPHPFALMEHGQPPKQDRISVGSEIEGWTVEAILLDRIVLARGDTRVEIKVKDEPPPHPGIPLRGGAPAPPAPQAAVTSQRGAPSPTPVQPPDNNLALRLFGGRAPMRPGQ